MQLLMKPIQLADQVVKAADEATSNKQDCAELKLKTEKLAALLRQVARSRAELYERPTRRIIDDTEQVLKKAFSLVFKCRANCLIKRVFTIIPAAAFRKMSSRLENSIRNVSWLLRVFASADDRGEKYQGLPPILANEPILCSIWEQIAILFTGSLDKRSDAAANLVYLARDNDQYGKLIVEEGGVGPLLKLVKEGKLEGQENAAKAIGLLGRDPESVEHMIHSGVCTVFAKILKEGPMKVQAVVAWAVSELAGNHPKCQDLFAQNNIIRLLVGHLAFETVQEHSKTNNVNGNNNKMVVVVDDDDDRQFPHPLWNCKTWLTPNQMHNVVASTMAMKRGTTTTTATNPQEYGTNLSNGHVNNNVKLNHQSQSPQQSLSHSGGSSNKGRELEDPATNTNMNKMAARALWHLAKGNAPICHIISKSRALLYFAVLLEKGPEDVQTNSAMALMEITAVAEQDTELRKSAFKPNSPACKAVVDQLLKIIEMADSDLLIPCIKSIGNLARIFRATETRMIAPLVKLLVKREAEISREASIALGKFACNDNYLHTDHSKAIISAGGAEHLIQLVYFANQNVQLPALILLSYIALHVPESEEIAKAEVLTMLEWASKQSYMTQDKRIDPLLQEAKSRLELYQLPVQRNRLVHDLESNASDDMVLWASNFLDEWQAALHKVPHNPKSKEALAKWKPPDRGFWKINSNAATCYSSSKIGLGIIIRDNSGLVTAAGSFKMQAVYSPLVAKVMAVWRGIRMAIEFGSVPFLIESDSLQVVELVNKGVPSPADVGSIIGLILSILKDAPGCAVSHISRVGPLLYPKCRSTATLPL
ncbi:hypothetical protein LWI29_000188 [Acer saccharum]|uniref:Uncharacterized protein n=1 Tax=Acer saccharum TaxID=4024 RepID=A0AA39SWN9_ACESA|nr:hypothetical protein LWI29_000188 [Acer saccharum]